MRVTKKMLKNGYSGPGELDNAVAEFTDGKRNGLGVDESIAGEYKDDVLNGYAINKITKNINNDLKWVQVAPFGVSTRAKWTAGRPGDNGTPPGPQNAPGGPREPKGAQGGPAPLRLPISLIVGPWALLVRTLKSSGLRQTRRDLDHG